MFSLTFSQVSKETLKYSLRCWSIRMGTHLNSFKYMAQKVQFILFSKSYDSYSRENVPLTIDIFRYIFYENVDSKLVEFDISKSFLFFFFFFEMLFFVISFEVKNVVKWNTIVCYKRIHVFLSRRGVTSLSVPLWTQTGTFSAFVHTDTNGNRSKFVEWNSLVG